ncbi:MAG TPA: NUDIX hydrolase [Candidatus Saccharimonadales bacterium]|nr:NUDIX hydrolase [Candidatus Saccharimonadales bacterium]
MDIKQRIACKAVIGKDDKVLVLREASTYEEGVNGGRWHIPGGRIEPGEPFLEGLQREVTEETGLKIVCEEPLYVGEWFPVIKDQKNQIVAVYFACSLASTDDDVQLSEEHDEYRWVAAKEATDLDIMSPEHDVIARYFATRKHQG